MPARNAEISGAAARQPMPISAWHAAMVISVISSMLNFIIMACFLRKWMLNASTISMWTLASTLQAGGDRTVPYGAESWRRA